MYEAGYTGITIDTAYGGQGLTRDHQRVVTEESAAYAIPRPGGIASAVTLGIVLPTLLQHASEEQKRDWIPKILRAEEIWVQLLSEPGAGSDLAGLLTRATRDGDSWVIEGTKVWSSGAMSADYGICLARTNWDSPKHRGLTWFKVPLRDPNVTVRPVREINGSSEFCEEFLDGVTVTDDMRIGDVDQGWPIANFMLAVERGGGDAPAPTTRSSSARRLPADLVALAEGRGTLSDGATRQAISRAHVDEVMHGHLIGRVIASMRTGKANPALASLIKLGTGINDPKRADLAMELGGHQAVAWPTDGGVGHETAIGFLNGRIYAIAGGTNQIQRNIVGERLLGLPREPSVDGDKPFRDVLRDAKEWGRKPS
jgi:alkylation response protein AidB-like acyl-CoA dehydrogenase